MIERITNSIDNLNHKVGEGAIWLTLAMIIFQFLVVLLSKVFGFSFTPLDESVWYCNGLMFMLGAAYTLLHNQHVRVDLFYGEATDHYKALVDFWGCLLFIIPVTFMTFGLSWGFVLDSWFNFSTGQWQLERAEGTPSSLPLLSAYKTIIWVYSFFVALAAISMAGKAWLFLSGKHASYTPDPSYTPKMASNQGAQR